MTSSLAQDFIDIIVEHKGFFIAVLLLTICKYHNFIIYDYYLI